ncbi:phosphate propanoyltransferase [Anaeroselena agilis]|uniref:Phosphate propanoyltransferase n=1 Tax=Anaeroselena agilis TaxID=3063788 RepID=A0ABU3NW00_9FIRM|nr:phosphate propanoyltransferase [Selenomonadales bacterium 4137-cl]
MPGKLVPVGISARHVHVCQEHLDVLFGVGHKLTPYKDLYQIGYYAAEETVDLVTAKGTLKKVRILGPERKTSQVEISRSDALKLGISVPVRDSGDLDGSPPITLVGPRGSVTLPKGVIAAWRHIHMDPADAAAFGVKDRAYVRVKCLNATRPLIFENVLVRVLEGWLLEMHLDTDEANAAMLNNGDRVEIL